MRWWTRLRAAGATVIDLDQRGFTFPSADGEFLVLSFEFRQDVRAYFATRVGVPVANGTLHTAIQFNRAHAAVEMPFFNQDIFVFCAALAQGPNTPQPLFNGMTYNEALQSTTTPALMASTRHLDNSTSMRLFPLLTIQRGRPTCFIAILADSTSPAQAWLLRLVIPLFKCQPPWCFRPLWASAFSALLSANPR